MIKFSDLSEIQIKEWLESKREKPFRAKQLMQWVYQKGVHDLQEMTNLSNKFREQAQKEMDFSLIPIVKQETAADGTIKFLQELHDGHHIESVLMDHDDYYTICISTQVGCAMGCKFCLTATMGLKRNLTQGEIIDQVLNGNSLLPEGKTIRNIVYMGMGEPFHNYENTMSSLKMFLNPEGLDFSNRRITISTSGLVPEIRRFGKEEVKCNLAISLNGVTQEARKLLMPVSRRYSLEDLIDACRSFPHDSRKRITFEYIMLKDITDSIPSAKALVKLVHGTKSKVNLIPFNTNPHMEFKGSNMDQIKKFQQYLLDHGVIATLRISKGQDISAACGQLAVNKDKENAVESK